jgi:sarcosine oxidase subunit delta
MRITCPNCGARDSAEFSCLGNAPGPRPADDAPVADWVEFVYHPANPKGPVAELWQHVLGCRAWLVVTRDTGDHGITEVRLAAAARR